MQKVWTTIPKSGDMSTKLLEYLYEIQTLQNYLEDKDKNKVKIEKCRCCGTAKQLPPKTLISSKLEARSPITRTSDRSFTTKVHKARVHTENMYTQQHRRSILYKMTARVGVIMPTSIVTIRIRV